MSRGVTLVELLIVLALMGVLGAAVAPSLFRPDRRDDLTRAAAAVSGVLNRARAIAVTEATPVEVAVHPERGRAWISVGSSTPEDARLELPEGIKIVGFGDRPVFRWRPGGVASADSLVLEHEGQVVLIRIDPWTGVPDVQRR